MTEYTTKDSGERQQWESGMMRDVQTGKPRFSLVVTSAQPYEDQMLTRYARLLARGAEKYEDRNWEQGSGDAELEYAKESLLRHTMQLITGETDEDHAAAVWFNAQVIEYIRWRQDQDVVAFNEAVADGYATEWLARYDEEHPETALADQWRDVGWVREPGDPEPSSELPTLSVSMDDVKPETIKLATGMSDDDYQAELERQLEVDQAAPEPTPFTRAAKIFGDHLVEDENGTVTFQIEESQPEVEPVLRMPNYSNVTVKREDLDYNGDTLDLMRAAQQLGLDRDQRSR